MCRVCVKRVCGWSECAPCFATQTPARPLLRPAVWTAVEAYPACTARTPTRVAASMAMRDVFSVPNIRIGSSKTYFTY